MSLQAGQGSVEPDGPQLPYRYEVTLTVTLRGDGQHSDGNGATATANRLAQQIALDPKVDGVLPSHPRCIRTGNR